ncbi:NAD-dependent nucleoside diphosphate-sugar epimerase/dehydratase [Citrifermentans bemidjiense Bem]|uniref:NAD-dependent nucleoside diphosphate-sugar epimerase/dehydratase n=1 Tax=Citrifermentans bemidjiense (strain ATCC BAA-1014 / DSM 16622 / JCM 12645 / Bem) TaxID=404380 RepID=B5EDT9_CITBB|nr:NAD(P)-dependent oxidoreductase [Citrifermentans bemidjiense]ACH40717.1 NAD-dependent nucleoside diphosphate-sugar epimerase/dehydratase [Citrifermentans bemidjiense Bem]
MTVHNAQKQVLVTGATGFIGRHAVSLLESRGIATHSCARSTGCDLEQNGALAPFQGRGITHVIHLGGRTFVPHSWEDPGAFYRANTLGTQQLLDFCRISGARLVYVSAYVYGVPHTLPIAESHPVAPNTPYNHSKWLAEELCRFYADHFEVPVTVLRPFNIFGPGQGEDFLIPTILKQAKSGGTITVKDAAPRRDYLHVDDLAEALLLALDLEPRFSLFNVGSGRSISVGELLDMAVRYSPRPLCWQATGEIRVNEVPDTVADISAITRALGWLPRRTLEQFLKSELA